MLQDGILTQVSEVIKTALGPIQQQLQGSITTNAQAAARSQIKELAGELGPDGKNQLVVDSFSACIQASAAKTSPAQVNRIMGGRMTIT